MDKQLDYLTKLQQDMLEQFKGQPKMKAVHAAIARQLQELFEFFFALNTMRSLQNAAGVQLDGIGDIVVMSRTEACAVAGLANQTVPMDDETYRQYLAWKANLNTNNCTHREIYNALKMFWDKSPLYYSEDPTRPATMFFATPTLGPEDNASVLLLAPKIKAAGVGLYITATTETLNNPCTLRAGGAAFSGVMTTKLPAHDPLQTFEQKTCVTTKGASVTQTTLQQI